MKFGSRIAGLFGRSKPSPTTGEPGSFGDAGAGRVVPSLPPPPEAEPRTPRQGTAEDARINAVKQRRSPDAVIMDAFCEVVERPPAVFDASRLPYPAGLIRATFQRALERERSPERAAQIRSLLMTLDDFFEVDERDRILVDLVNERADGLDLAASPEGEVATLLEMKYRTPPDQRAPFDARIAAVLRGEGFIKAGDYRSFAAELERRRRTGPH